MREVGSDGDGVVLDDGKRSRRRLLRVFSILIRWSVLQHDADGAQDRAQALTCRMSLC